MYVMKIEIKMAAVLHRNRSFNEFFVDKLLNVITNDNILCMNVFTKYLNVAYNKGAKMIII